MQCEILVQKFWNLTSMISVYRFIEYMGNYVKLLCSWHSDHGDIICEIEYMLVYIQ